MVNKAFMEGIILSLGSVNADFQVRIDQPVGSTTTMLAHDFMRLGGGKAANVAYLADLLGVPASLIARVGDDVLQEQALASLRGTKVDMSGVRPVKGCATAFSMIVVPPDGKKNIILASNANDQWEPADQDEVRQIIQEAPSESVLVVDYEIPSFIVEEAVRAARKRGFPVILDPSPPDRVDPALFSSINYIVPDISETKELTGIQADSVDEATQAAQQLVSQGVDTAIVKLGEGGCVVATSEVIMHVPTVSVAAVDTTGAGDAFAGAFATAVLEQRPLSEAACFATAAATAATTKYGSQPAYPSRERIQPLYDQICARVKITHRHKS